MLQPIAGRVAVVTGGSKGIGKGIARTLARHGVRVLIASRGEAAARGVVDEIGVLARVPRALNFRDPGRALTERA